MIEYDPTRIDYEIDYYLYDPTHSDLRRMRRRLRVWKRFYKKRNSRGMKGK